MQRLRRKKQRSVKRPKEEKEPPNCLEDSQLNHMERTLSNLLSCQKIMQCGPGFQFLWLVTQTGMNFGDTAVFESFLFVLVTPSQIPVNSSNDTHWFSEVKFGSFTAFICSGFHIWAE